MANTMSIQEVLAIFERFSKEVRFKRYENSDGCGNKCCLWANGEIGGTRLEAGVAFTDSSSIQHPILLTHSDTRVWLKMDGEMVFSDSTRESGYGTLDERLIHEFVRKMATPLKEEQYRRYQEEEEKKERVAADAAEKLRKLLR